MKNLYITWACFCNAIYRLFGKDLLIGVCALKRIFVWRKSDFSSTTHPKLKIYIFEIIIFDLT